jgi:hypothetical protein
MSRADQCVPRVPSGLFLLALGWRWLDRPERILPLLLVVAPLNVAANGGGYAVNHLDIAPQLASFVLAFYNMGGQVMGWMTPWIIGELTPYPNGRSRAQIMEATGLAPTASWLQSLSKEWRTTFLLGGCCNLAGAVVFLALASDQVQPWARLRKHGDSATSTSSSSATCSTHHT